MYFPYIFYHNYSQRPKGYYSTIKDYINEKSQDGDIYHEIYPQSVSRLDIPDHLLKDSSPYLSYEPEANESAKFILEVKNGRIYTDCLFTIGVISEDDKLIGEVSLDLKTKNHKGVKENKIFKRKYFEDITHFKGTVFSTIAGGGSYFNYYHWLIDSFSRLHLLKKSGLFDKVDWFYVPTIEYDYQIDSLKAFGIPEEKIIDSKKYPHIKADLILAPSYTRGSHYHVHDWVVDFFYQHFGPSDESKFKDGRYFISRKDSSIRNITNEDKVSDLLSKYNIETILLSKLSFQDKINLFANSKLIIGGSGAGMTNLMFCKEGTTIVEIFGDQFIDFSHYYALAAKRKLDYHYLIGKNVGKVNSMVEGQNNDITIELDSLKRLLEKELLLKKSEVHHI